VSVTKGHAFELIPLAIEAKGEVIASNVDEFREMVQTALAAINREPATDEEFGQAEVDVKALKGAEDSVKSAKEKALADAEQLHALFGALDETSEEIREARLDLEKVVKAKKAEVRNQLISIALDGIKIDLPPMQVSKLFQPELESAVKGKRTLASMKKAFDTAVKVANGRIGKAREILEEFEQEHGREMILDRVELETKTPDQVESELRRRLDVKRADDEKRKAQEEAAKAKAEAEEAKAEAEEAKKPAPLPTPPKVGSLPTGPSEPAEWAGFVAAVLLAFKPLKEAKNALTHEGNRAKANEFAGAVNAAWIAAKKKEVTA